MGTEQIRPPLTSYADERVKPVCAIVPALTTIAIVTGESICTMLRRINMPMPSRYISGLKAEKPYSEALCIIAHLIRMSHKAQEHAIREFLLL